MARFQDVLRAHEGRLTQERQSLLHIICASVGHFNPEEVAGLARSKGRPVSLTTVYRNLPLLIEAGIVRRATVGDGLDRAGVRYERVWNRTHHDHLTCERCGRVVEFSYPAIEILQDAVAREHGFLLERHHLELIGVCASCRRKAGALSARPTRRPH